MMMREQYSEGDWLRIQWLTKFMYGIETELMAYPYG